MLAAAFRGDNGNKQEDALDGYAYDAGVDG